MSAAPQEHPLDQFIRPPESAPRTAALDGRQIREIVALMLLVLGVLLGIATLGLYDYRLGLGGIAVALVGAGITLAIER